MTGTPRKWVYVHADHLTDAVGPLARLSPADTGIVMVESRPWFSRRPYHRQRLATIIANMRAFAAEQRARGVTVEYLEGPEPLGEALARVVATRGPLTMMEAAEREVRRELAPLVDAGKLIVVPHEGWLTTREEFAAATGRGGAFRMDAFYRAVRRRTGLLMDADGKPLGGRFSLDGENRKPWRGQPPAPDPPRFPMDAIRREVGDHIESVYSRHPGRLDMRAIPVSHADAETLWAWARRECLGRFGDFEDAMSTASTGLFHTRVSPLLNLHRLLPGRLVKEVADLDVPLNSKEGFIRQVLGWREFVRHVHEATDGFRLDAPPPERAPGDGGYAAWAGQPWDAPQPTEGIDGGANPNALGGDLPLPPAYWGRPSGLNCLDTVVRSVWEEGWSHHITRLMVLSNIATLLGVNPRELTDWFWVAYADSWDWVVEPNVLGMGTFSAGEVMTTKPYVSGAAYIDKMSDYCRGCRFSPKDDCPLRRLYWAFLVRHRERLGSNQRMWTVYNGLAKRPESERLRDAAEYERVRGVLSAGGELRPGK
jgi:deoxyribodipyrimidine photolyase-related protein